MKTNNYNEFKTNLLDKDSQSNKCLTIASGVTASLTAIVAAGNFALGNELIGLQNLGATIALLGYVVGYSKRTKINNQEKQDILENPTTEDISLDNLRKLRFEIEKLKNTIGTSTIAGIGFGLSAIATAYITYTDSLMLAGVTALTGTISLFQFIIAHDRALKLKDKQERYNLLKEIDEITKQPIPELIETPEDEKRLRK